MRSYSFTKIRMRGWYSGVLGIPSCSNAHSHSIYNRSLTTIPNKEIKIGIEISIRNMWLARTWIPTREGWKLDHRTRGLVQKHSLNESCDTSYASFWVNSLTLFPRIEGFGNVGPNVSLQLKRHSHSAERIGVLCRNRVRLQRFGNETNVFDRKIELE